MTLWPEFKIPIPDPDLGFTGEIFCGKGSLTPEQTLVEFISTSASYHSVKKQPLRALEWDLLKVFPFNVMPANAAAWYMAKRKFYMNQPLDQQLLPFLLKKYPEKFRVIGGSVIFLEVYKKDVAKAKLKYLVQYGLNAYFSHKADEYGVYFFDPFYYENTEPFHESLKQCSNGAKKLVQNYFNSPGIKDQFKFRHHSAYLVSISKQPDIKIVTNKTGVIISMINNQYGFIKFGDSGETALFCCKSLFKEGWQFSGDPLKLPAMKFDGYQIPGGGMKGEQAYSWYAVLVWCGRRPSPKYCSTAEDLNSTPVFREGRLQRMSVSGDGKRLRQPSSSMMVGQVMEIRRNGAILKVREDSSDKVFVPGWQRQITTCDGKWLSTLSGECIGLGDLVAYYVDTQDIKPGYTTVGKNVMVLKECQEVTEKPKRRRRRQSTERSAGARYEVGETTDADDENWLLPVMYVVCLDLRLFALQADKQKRSAGRGKPGETLEKASEGIMACFRVCAADARAAEDVTKRWGMLNLVNQLFKIYFKVNKLHLCKPLIRAVESSALKDRFSKSQLVTYRYYVGRKYMFDNNLKEAEEYLRYSFEHCYRESQSNKRLILIYLIPVKMLLGQMPKISLLKKYDLSEFTGVMEAVKEGNVFNLNKALEEHERTFINWGIFLILEKLKIITYRNLFKKVTLLMPSHQISVEAYTTALKMMKVEDIDNDETACILANLIYQGRIKGYISHQHNKLVVSKQNAFPPLSAAS